ncbi:MAG TPA: G-D-S-L family lipolytic protein [Candidatus Marinimicrobia bacterium]|nr:G-D-S-L family lipolytic protein [Candidatus Neomarinimicrobiota bacterium]
MNGKLPRSPFAILWILAGFMLNCTQPTPISILFLGDSITELGVKPDGYVTLIQKEIDRRFPKRDIKITGAGISGNKVPDLEARLEGDVLSKKPDIVVIYIGINDVWHSILPGHSGTSRQDFRAGLMRIIEQIKKINAEIILCTPSVVGEKIDNGNPLDEQLDQYSEIIRELAAIEKLHLIDLRQQFKAYLLRNNPENRAEDILTYDGIHLNNRGNQFVADVMIHTLIDLL